VWVGVHTCSKRASRQASKHVGDGEIAGEGRVSHSTPSRRGMCHGSMAGLPGAARLHGASVRSGQSTTDTLANSKFSFKPASSTERRCGGNEVVGEMGRKEGKSAMSEPGRVLKSTASDIWRAMRHVWRLLTICDFCRSRHVQIG